MHAPIAKRSTRFYPCRVLPRATTLRDGWPTIEPSAEHSRDSPPPSRSSSAFAISENDGGSAAYPHYWKRGDSTRSGYRAEPRPAELSRRLTLTRAREKERERERERTWQACTDQPLPLLSLALSAVSPFARACTRVHAFQPPCVPLSSSFPVAVPLFASWSRD